VNPGRENAKPKEDTDVRKNDLAKLVRGEHHRIGIKVCLLNVKTTDVTASKSETNDLCHSGKLGQEHSGTGTLASQTATKDSIGDHRSPARKTY
jgi:hypothetical protein